VGSRVKSFNRVAAPTTFFLAPFNLGVANFVLMIVGFFYATFTGGPPLLVFAGFVVSHGVLISAVTTQPLFMRVIETAIENFYLAVRNRTRNIRYVRV
jgi:hypothetical protein